EALRSLGVTGLRADQNVVRDVRGRDTVVVDEVPHKDGLARAGCPIDTADHLGFVAVVQDAVLHYATGVCRCREISKQLQAGRVVLGDWNLIARVGFASVSFAAASFW